MNDPTTGAPFPLPRRIPPEAGGFPPLELEALAQWIDGHPLADTQSAAATMLEAVHAINRVAIAPERLGPLADLLDSRVLPMLDLLDQRLRQLPVPLGRKSRALAETYTALSGELTITHLQRADDALQQGGTADPGALPHLARALLLTGCRCMHAWRLYQPVPEGIWLLIHRIFAAAERSGVASRAAPLHDNHHALVADSIDGLTARLAVLSATNVHALRQGEIDHLARWLNPLPLRCLDTPPADGGDGTPYLRILLDEDRLPSLLAGGHPPDTGTARYVALGPVLAAIRSGPGDPPRGWHPVSTGLDQRLLNLWVVGPKRHFSREPADTGPVISVTGLADIHALVRADYRHQRKLARGETSLFPSGVFVPGSDGDGSRIPGVFAGDRAEADEDSGLSLEERTTDTPGGTRWLADQDMDRLAVAWNSALRGIDPRLQDAGAAPAGRVPRPIAARLRDLGAGGLSLRLCAPAQKVFSGDLIAIRTTRQRHVYWQLGMIRWLRYDDPEDVTVGVQFLAPVCSPTEIQAYRAKRPSGKASPGLFLRLPGEPARGSLLFAPGTFAEGTRVVFRQSGELQTVSLDTIRSESHTFARADFLLSEVALA
ncbi:hypothetical protein TVNIR_3148 [Thioalkalivibrio nitratireducens DSM 14787]|uniref:PilZ domain-containing protein n=1 Tax=Thioalkalivibrio nitratireducens (strain DSM 14787 / UNIQEM 213 / ALEN2) TaxID=1255043 RepID=L0E0P2_THIND|nr:hypothetical protein [Thioalkalivibrio nitratireducens]AGA34785.1 hypothetical protein TVNIR_3148 [Thioalkalivibrio nitratireducens DSM 14787]